MIKAEGTDYGLRIVVSGDVTPAVLHEVQRTLHHHLTAIQGAPSLFIDLRDVAVAPESDEDLMRGILKYILKRGVDRAAVIFTTSTQILSLAKLVNAEKATDKVRYFSPIFRGDWEVYALKWLTDGKCPITYHPGSSGAHPIITAIDIERIEKCR